MRAEKPHPVAKSRVNARNRTKTLSHIQPSGSKAYASNERLFAARDEAPQRAFKSSRVHRPPRFPTFKAQRSAIFSFAQQGDSSFARKIKKIQIHATTRRKDATVQSATRRAHRIAKYQYREYRNTKRERERGRDECVCAHLERHVFSLLNRFFFVVFMRKRTALFGRKLASEKEINWTKLGTLRSALMYHSTHSFTRREREKTVSYTHLTLPTKA